ncbi:hypothetical protein PBY51_004393 [Eleginops maclovinus]|uniref:Uncharacterized protein n=1 Tax=Eleginops maclovinus TaxID=56733 RepID=A0AAN8AWB0_ELEMC|nr:hypothetical protein PBY51_004393 [Eleginops maclovinus]
MVVTTKGLLWRSEGERGVSWLIGDSPSDANELLAARLHGARAEREHGGPGDKEGLLGGGRPTAGAEDWVGWGPCSGTQSLALRPRQMAAEQGGWRETLVHSEWPSVGEQRARTGETDTGQEVGG